MPRITDFPEFSDLPTEEDVEKFQYLSPALDSLYEEVSKLSAKKQDVPLSEYKIKMINRVLEGVKSFLRDDPATKELGLLSNEDLPQNSDVVLLLGQFKAALSRFHTAFHGWDTYSTKPRWFTQENPPDYLLEDEEAEEDAEE